MKASAKGYKSESDVQGKPAPVAGKYHVNITHVNDTRQKKDGSLLPYTIVEYEVLDGTVPGQDGKGVTQFINLDENGSETPEYIEKATRLCLAAGIIRPDEERDVDASELENCQVVIGVENWESKTTKKTQSGIGSYGLDIWSVDNPEVASVPKDLEAIRLWKEAKGEAVGTAAGNGSGNGQSAPSGNGNGAGTVNKTTPPVTGTGKPVATAAADPNNFDDV